MKPLLDCDEPACDEPACDEPARDERRAESAASACATVTASGADCSSIHSDSHSSSSAVGG
eukprot:4706064-Prymnesium_polylepis.1